METASQTEAKAKADRNTKSTTTTLSTAAAVTFKGATGNRKSYTQNISPIKEKVNPHKQSTSKFIEIQNNNKTKIKIKIKIKQNHLKSLLIHFYFNFILLSVSQINRKILKTIKDTNYSYANSSNCINVNLIILKKLTEKAFRFKTISFMLHVAINFLNKFHYCSRKTKKTHIKLTIIYNNKTKNHFRGICLKRLISLMRLQQQIPKHYNKPNESSLLKQIIERICPYKYLREKYKRSTDDRELSVSKTKNKNSGNIPQIDETLKQNKNDFKKHKQQNKTHKSCYTEGPFKNCCRKSLQKKENFTKTLQLAKLSETLNSTACSKHWALPQPFRIRFVKCDPHHFHFVYMKKNRDQTKTAKSLHLSATEPILNKTIFKLFLMRFKNCDQLLKYKYEKAKLYKQTFANHPHENCYPQDKQEILNYFKINYDRSLFHSRGKIGDELNQKDIQNCCETIAHELSLATNRILFTTPAHSTTQFYQLISYIGELENYNSNNKDLKFPYKNVIKQVFENNFKEFVKTFKEQQRNKPNDQPDQTDQTDYNHVSAHRIALSSQQNIFHKFKFLVKKMKMNLRISAVHKNKNQETIKHHHFHQNLPRNLVSSPIVFSRAQEQAEEKGNKINTKRQFLLDNNRNSCQIESKQERFFQKFQRFLYFILILYCCICYWHIYGFPSVAIGIFKYLSDATVHVLTQRLIITITTTTTIIIITKIKTIPTSIYHDNDGNIKETSAHYGKLKKPTKVGYCNKDNQQKNVFQSKHSHTVAAFSCCSTSSLTASYSWCCKSLKNFILQKKQSQLSWLSSRHYQQYHYHHYQHNQQNHQLQHEQQEQRQQQKYNSSSTMHLQLPSLLVVSRTLIILILLSSLWHTSEGFHGSGVKLSANTVKTKYGLVRGIVVRSSPSLVEAYLGIPYASPPVGSLRFMPPITPSTWKNVRNADRFSPVCPQNVPIPPNGPEALLEVPRARLAQLRRLLPLLSNQSEDCLYLNIYVPYENRRHKRFTSNNGELNNSSTLPTILFIHGESYEWNSGNPYDGSELAGHGNVIVVTINFRLGILGFLKTGGKESAQGNFGLMDLVAGLHWLKENLPAFGGDSQQITLLGHGTGAALANILVVSPVASDLIQHTVMVSGSALSPWAIQKNPLFVKRRVAEQTGCHGDMLYYDLAPCLRTKTLTELLAVKVDHPRFLVGFAPFIDGTVISPNTNAMDKLSLPLGSAIVSTSGIEYANFPKRNLIFCLTSVESHLDLNAQDLEFGFNETRRDRILRTYVRNNFHYHLNEIFAVLKNEYTDWDKAIRSPLSSRDATLQFLSDGHTASSLIKLGYMHSLRGGRGYFLHFKHRTVEEEYPQRTGSVRGEDVPFWLGLPISPLFPHNYTTQEKQISRLMLRYLANFAKTGNPNQSAFSSPLPSLSSLIGTLSSPVSSISSSQTANGSHEKIKRSSFNIVNATSSTSSSPDYSGPIKSSNVSTAAAREALNLAVLYNQRRTKRTYYKRHSRSYDDHSGSNSNELNYFSNTNNNNNKLESDELPFWDAYDVVNQLYMELGNKAEIQSHYRGHKLSMWLNLIPQLHRHANMNDQSMRHHQFQDDLNNLNLYEGIVRAQVQIKPDDDDEDFLLLRKAKPTTHPPVVQEMNITQKSAQGSTTECGVDGAMFVAEMTTLPPTDNRSLLLHGREKEMATASTGIIGNLEVLRRLSGKQFQSYPTALVATVAVGCFLLILNFLIFAGIYHQREKRARDAKTKEELQDNDTSKNSSILKLNALGSETGSFNGSSAGISGKTTVVFGEYSCYDEKTLQTKEDKLMVELPPSQMLDTNWAACSTSTLDLLKTKPHTSLNTTYTVGNVIPLNADAQTEHLVAVNNLEMASYNPLPMTAALIIDPAFVPASSSGLLSKRGSFVDSSGHLNQYDFASVQSSDQMSFKDIENAVKASAAMSDNITQDDDIPEPPPPPRSFQNLQQQQQQVLAAVNVPTTSSGTGGGGGILRQTGTTSTTQASGTKKRVHIQEISV